MSELKRALAAQEEHIKRQLSCRGVVGANHAYRSFGIPTKTDVNISRCVVCKVTETAEDFEKSL